MGLGRWLLMKIAGALWVPPHQHVRRYRVTLFGEPLGTYTLPVTDHAADPRAPVRPVLTRPFRVDFGDHSFYYWAEHNQKGDGFKTVEWHPPTPEQRAEADDFYRSAHGLNDDFSVNPARQPPLPTRTIEEMRLIHAILADRDAEQPYRDYAAWLTAKGDAYGEYIRLSLDAEKLPEGDARRERLEAQRERLAERHGPRWVLPLADLGLYPGVYMSGFDGYMPSIWYDARGVISELDVGSEALVFPAHGARLFHAAPFLRKLSVNRCDATVADFAFLPQMAQIESLSLSVGDCTPDEFRSFARSPHLGGLRELWLSGYRFGPVAAARLADAAWLANVHTLDISHNAIGDDGAEAFADSPLVASLTTFELGSNDLTDRGLSALCRSPHLAGLTALHVGCNQFTAEGVRAIPAAAFAANLKSLSAGSCGLSPEAFQALASGNFPALMALDVAYNDGGEGLIAVVGAPFFRTLVVFRASSNAAGPGLAAAIAAIGFVPLRELSLGSNRLTDEAVITLARSKVVTKLTALDLSHNPFGLEGVKALAAADLPLLETLDLSGVEVGRPGATALAESPHFKGLKRLIVSDEHVGLIGRERLTKRFGGEVVSFS